MRTAILALSAAPLIGLPALGLAQTTGPVGTLDAYYVPKADLDVSVPNLGDGDDDGDGFGVKGLFRFSDTLGFVGEYQGVTYDDTDIDFNQLRAGMGWFLPTTSGVYVQYDDFELDDADADGFSVHGRLAGDISPTAQLYLEAGYFWLEDDFEDLEGYEFTFGGALALAPQWGVFADYRMTNLEGEDTEIEYEFGDLRLGVRFLF